MCARQLSPLLAPHIRARHPEQLLRVTAADFLRHTWVVVPKQRLAVGRVPLDRAISPCTFVYRVGALYMLDESEIVGYLS